MPTDWIPRLRGHADLVQRLVKEVPEALDRPKLTIEQAKRLHAVIQKGARDFDEVLQLMIGPDVDESYRKAADSLTQIWSHLSDAAADRVEALSEDLTAEQAGDPTR